MTAHHTIPPRVVTFGELLLRLSPTDGEAFFQSPMFHASFGGAEANVAVALAHLGRRAEYVTRLPDNLIGDAALAALRAEGVEVDRVLRGPERMGLYFVEPGADMSLTRLVYDRAGSAFAHLGRESIDWRTVLAGASWFHGTGITPALGDGPMAALAAAFDAARALRVPVSLDLNYRAALWRGRDPRPLLRPFAADIDLLIGNRDAFREMLGVDAGGQWNAPDVDRLCAMIVDRVRCRRIAVTRREVLSASTHRWSAALFDGPTNALSMSRVHDVRVVDRMGGGDSFAAALIWAQLRDWDPERCVEFAVAASGLKVGTVGDFCRVTERDVIQMMERAVAVNP